MDQGAKFNKKIRHNRLEMEGKICRLLMTQMRILRMTTQPTLIHWRTGEHRDQLTQTGLLETKEKGR